MGQTFELLEQKGHKISVVVPLWVEEPVERELKMNLFYEAKASLIFTQSKDSCERFVLRSRFRDGFADSKRESRPSMKDSKERKEIREGCAKGH